MIDELPPPVATFETPARASRLAHPANLFIVAAGLAAVAAIATGLALGFLVMSISGSDCTPSDGWCELGAAVFGALAGILTGAIAYVVAGVVVIRRHRPIGRRAMPTCVHLGAPFVLAVIALALAGLAP